MEKAVKRCSGIAENRYYLVHGEWWLDHLESGVLKVRRVWKGEIAHLKDVTPDILNKLSAELDEIADDLDEVEYSAKAYEKTGD